MLALVGTDTASRPSISINDGPKLDKGGTSLCQLSLGGERHGQTGTGRARRTKRRTKRRTERRAERVDAAPHDAGADLGFWRRAPSNCRWQFLARTGEGGRAPPSPLTCRGYLTSPIRSASWRLSLVISFG